MWSKALEKSNPGSRRDNIFSPGSRSVLAGSRSNHRDMSGIPVGILEITSRILLDPGYFFPDIPGRQQRIKIGPKCSGWLKINGGVPQGTLSGPEDFLHMIDDFSTCLSDIKYVDDTTIFEIVRSGEVSRLQQAADDAVEWATANNMKLNASKTK